MRLEAGSMLPAVVEELRGVLDLAFCSVTGFGELEWVELAVPRGEAPIRIDGPLTLLNMQGRLRRAGDVSITDIVCTLSRWTETGLQVLGGQLVGGRAAYLELSFTSLSVVDPPRGAVHPPSRIEVAPEPKSQSAARPQKQEPSPSTAKWAEAIAESRKMEREGRAGRWDEAEVIMPKRGDVVNHLHFGRCTVAKIDDEHVSLKKPDGRVVQLGLTILEFRNAAKASDGKPEYDVVIRKG